MLPSEGIRKGRDDLIQMPALSNRVRRLVMSWQRAFPTMAPGFDKNLPSMISRPAAFLHSYASLVRRLPQATEAIFTARSSLGRSIKIILFGVGAILPLGSLIWALLYWHGCGVRRC